MGNPARNILCFAGSRSVYGFVNIALKAMLNSFLSVFLLVLFMSMLKRLEEQDCWEVFYEHKIQQGNISKKDAADLRAFIDQREYLSVTSRLHEGFSAPRKMLISKANAGKKRVVYTFAREENYVLKLLSFLLREYDDLFAPNLYSFRKNSGVRRATENVLRIRNLDKCHVYKADISDYFNSVDVAKLLPELKAALSDDPELFCFLERLLKNPHVRYGSELIEESKGIMAGTPVSAFLANFYLRELDAYFYGKGIPYVRYSDDILVFTKSADELYESVETIRSTLSERKLKLNPKKEAVFAPGEKWTFLGFSYQAGVVDISEVSFEKLKGKMRRKARALQRWADKKNLPGECAAKAFVKRFNTKLYDNPVYNELTWTRWFFPVINTDETLKRIDEYMQDCIRFLATGRRTKARYDFRYEDIKRLGYRNLVNEYYKFLSEGKCENRLK